ncbi:MAG: hypothetical protein BroJett021_15450 [Chloroflexota bacterium]|nr:MAG: hypothetical protein BroJett021_15450 [Chloroflexota bacterium]
MRSCPSAQRIEALSDVRESGALPLVRAYAMRLNAFPPIVGLTDRVAVRVVGDETGKTPVGDFDAWGVTLDAGNSISQLRIANDAPNPLVKYIEGCNCAIYDLESYVAGK